MAFISIGIGIYGLAYGLPYALTPLLLGGFRMIVPFLQLTLVAGLLDGESALSGLGKLLVGVVGMLGMAHLVVSLGLLAYWLL